MRNDLEDQKLRPFLSIRWKLFLGVSCLIVLIHALFLVGVWRHHSAQYVAEKNKDNNELMQSLDSSINLLSNRLMKNLKVLAHTHKNEQDQSLTHLNLDINDNFSNMQSYQLVDYADLYDTSASLISHWGAYSEVDSALVSQVIKERKMVTRLNCVKSCSVLVAAPIFVNKKQMAVLVVQRNIDSLISRFGSEHNVELGIVRQLAVKADYVSWNTQVFNVTHSSLSIPLLVRLSQKETVLESSSEYVVQAFDREYAINFIDSQVSSNPLSKWVLIKDITERSQKFSNTTKNIFWWSGACLLISLLLLYIIVNRISHQLPRILAISHAIEEDESSGKMNRGGDRRILDDELQQYDRQLAKISHKMDLLKQKEANNAVKLQSMVRELNQTKNFIDRLLNEDETIILVQKLGGEIIALNQAGCMLFEIDDFHGLTYAEIFCSDLLEEDGLAALNYLYLGGETLVKAEVQWRNSQDESFVLLWVHALLSVPGTIEPVILSICVDITAQRKAEDRLEWLAFNDPKLVNYNKQVFLEYLPFAISRSLERHRILALLYCEISGFPNENATAEADLKQFILKDLSKRMSGCLRQYDMLTQLSADHFVIILEGLSDISDAEVVTDKIISIYNQPITVEHQDYSLQIVIGVSYAPEHSESVPQLLENAETAMYQAKRKGMSCLPAELNDEQV